VSGAITGATSGTFSAAVSIGTTLSVAGASTFTGNTTNKAIAYFANGTTYYVNASGAAKFASLTSAGAIDGKTGSFSSTLAVTGASTFTGKTTHNGGIGATSGTFSSTLSVTSTSTFTGKTTHNGGIGSTSGSFSSTLSVTSTSTLVGGATIGKSTADNGTYKLYVNGSSYTSGNFLSGGGITMYSMRKLKDIIDEKGLTLDELSIIKPTRFTWKDKRDNKIHIGGIADDVMKVLPEVVYKTDDDVLTMDYGNAAFAVASSLIKPVVDHEKRIAMLEEENKELRNEIERLKSA
jgi:hypothetical protein